MDPVTKKHDISLNPRFVTKHTYNYIFETRKHLKVLEPILGRLRKLKYTPDQLHMVSSNRYPYVRQTSEEKMLGKMELPAVAPDLYHIFK
jgi:hypothetical protein